MRSNRLKIVLIILLSIIVIALSSMLIAVIAFGYKLDFGASNYSLVKTESFDIEEIELLELNFLSADVDFYESNSDNIIIEQYASEKISEKNLFSSKQLGNKLNISDGKRNAVLYGFSFGFTKWNYKIYIPADYKDSVTIKTVSGEIHTNNAFVVLKDLTITSTSGDIFISSSIDMENFYTKTISGEIKVNEITANNIEMKMTSGDVEANSLNGVVKIESVSGEIDIKNLTGQIDIKTTSGDIEINNYKITEDSNIKTTSGEVEIKFTTDSSYEISSKTTSGDIKLPNNSLVYGNSPYNKLTIKTTSGDIIIK